jgi:hypothetical protein
MGPGRRCLLPGLAVALALGLAAPAPAQTVQVSPFAGYAFGGDLFEVATDHAVDRDGAPVFGGALSVEMADGFWFETLVSHEQADVEIREGSFGPRRRVRAVVNRWMAGGRQDLGTGRARPFLTGLLGLTHYGAEGDDEIRFTLSGGGGISLPLQRHLGVRLDGRVFTTFVDVDAAGRCSGGCVVGVSVNVVWQAEFTAGLVLVF